MVLGGFQRLDRRGFSLAELMVVIAIIGIIAAVSMPTLITYWRAATAKAGAEEVAAGVNRGRQLAIARNQNVCVQVAGNQYRYVLNTNAACVGGTIWTGQGTDATGFFTVANNVTLATNANPVFTNLGAAITGATMTVTSPQGALVHQVVIAPSGRVRIQ